MDLLRGEERVARRDRLRRLAEPHVVGEEQATRGKEALHALALVRVERALQRGERGQRGLHRGAARGEAAGALLLLADDRGGGRRRLELREVGEEPRATGGIAAHRLERPRAGDEPAHGRRHRVIDAKAREAIELATKREVGHPRQRFRRRRLAARLLRVLGSRVHVGRDDEEVLARAERAPHEVGAVAAAAQRVDPGELGPVRATSPLLLAGPRRRVRPEHRLLRPRLDREPVTLGEAPPPVERLERGLLDREVRVAGVPEHEVDDDLRRERPELATGGVEQRAAGLVEHRGETSQGCARGQRPRAGRRSRGGRPPRPASSGARRTRARARARARPRLRRR